MFLRGVGLGVTAGNCESENRGAGGARLGVGEAATANFSGIGDAGNANRGRSVVGEGAIGDSFGFGRRKMGGVPAARRDGEGAAEVVGPGNGMRRGGVSIGAVSGCQRDGVGAGARRGGVPATSLNGLGPTSGPWSSVNEASLLSVTLLVARLSSPLVTVGSWRTCAAMSFVEFAILVRFVREALNNCVSLCLKSSR